MVVDNQVMPDFLILSIQTQAEEAHQNLMVVDNPVMLGIPILSILVEEAHQNLVVVYLL
jgi:hypothetical protein